MSGLPQATSGHPNVQTHCAWSQGVSWSRGCQTSNCGQIEAFYLQISEKRVLLHPKDLREASMHWKVGRNSIWFDLLNDGHMCGEFLEDIKLDSPSSKGFYCRVRCAYVSRISVKPSNYRITKMMGCLLLSFLSPNLYQKITPHISTILNPFFTVSPNPPPPQAFSPRGRWSDLFWPSPAWWRQLRGPAGRSAAAEPRRISRGSCPPRSSEAWCCCLRKTLGTF